MISYDTCHRLNALLSCLSDSCKLYIRIEGIDIYFRVRKVRPSSRAGMIIIETGNYVPSEQVTLEVDARHKFDFFFV